jgi:signal transduction histidine kinase
VRGPGDQTEAEGALDYREVFERGGGRALIVQADAPRFTVAAVSDAYLQVLGLTREQVLGKSLAEVVSSSVPASGALDPDGALAASLARVLATGAADAVRLGSRGALASLGASSLPPSRHFRAQHVPLFGPGGQAQFIVQRLDDDDELVLLEQRVHDQDQHSALLGSLWPKNASDELRAPLMLMLGPIRDIVSGTRGVLPESVRADIELVQRNALRLERLVNALLDLSRSEGERAAAEYEPTDLARATAGIAALFRPAIERVGLTLELDCEPLHEPVYVDPELWEKVVVNLLSNAFKFTDEGKISVAVHAHGPEVALVVSDTGRGIPAADQPRLFERFFRAEGNKKERGPEGMGVGLALVRQLVRLHGGNVQIDSVERGGTAVTVRLPTGTTHLPPARVVKADPASRRASPAAAYLEELGLWLDRAAEADESPSIEPTSSGIKPGRARILIVDDDAAMLGYLSRTLSALWHVDVAVDGKSALARARDELPDLVISDVVMPGLDGYGLLRELRKDVRTRHVPVLLLSGRPEDRAAYEGIERGADDYLMRPFSERDLLTRVQSHLNTAELRRGWARELTHAHGELQAFSYSVSHDLRAPLRTIDGFSQTLLEDHASGLDEEGRRYLQRIRVAAQRMGSLIDDLLELSRVGRAALTPERVDLSALAEEALEGLAEREPGRSVYTFVVPGLWAAGDRRLLAMVLDHLLGNAWKFTSKRPLGRIEVGRERQGEREVFFVRDNGVGFELSDAGRLFSPFQRLHPGEFEGRGIGLTMVQRIIARHGGRIWVDAARDRGATFFFTLGEQE